MSECSCDARWSGWDDQEWLAKGAPACVCVIQAIAKPPVEKLLTGHLPGRFILANDPSHQWRAIDWGKIWKAHAAWLKVDPQGRDPYREHKIMEFVEAQLRGE